MLDWPDPKLPPINLYNAPKGSIVNAEDIMKELGPKIEDAKAMGDEYLKAVGAIHGKEVLSIVEEIIASKLYAEAMASICAVASLDEGVSSMIRTILVNHCAGSITRLIEAHDLDATTAQCEEWQLIAERYTDNLKSILNNTDLSSGVH
jgi:hypothetical protein